MTQPEFLAWIEFYKLYPFDDVARHHRPAALVAHAMAGGDVQQLLDWLHPPPPQPGLSEADMNTLRAFGFKGRP